MTKRDAVLQVVFTAIDEVNETRPPRERVVKAEETVLVGDGGALDSLALVNLIVSVEEGIERAFGVGISLVDMLTDKTGTGPFRTPAALADCIVALVP